MEELYHQIDLIKIAELATNYAVAEETKSILLHPNRISDKLILSNDLTITEQFSYLLKFFPIVLNDFDTPENELNLLKIEGATGSINTFSGILKIANNQKYLKQLVEKEESKSLDALRNFLNGIPELNIVRSAILKVFDDDTKIKTSASETLTQLRKSLIAAKSSSYKVFKNELQIYRKQQYLAEAEESVSNGRYVLRVLAEHKRKVKGIITGESDSGKTIFIEPLVCVQLNNEITSLELEERKEELKILKLLTKEIRPYLQDINIVYLNLIKADVYLSKAKLAVEMNAVMPVLTRQKCIKLVKAYHPLLYLHLKSKGQTQIPLDILLDAKQRIVLISGPNAGGKSVVLKTIGLYQAMLHNGYLIPAAKNSMIHLFDQLLLDIGDQQSVENDLSTYSAKLKFLQLALFNVNSETLVLIDEFGSGTDPLIGGALAEAVLEKFIVQGIFGVITTHYSNLKALAHNKNGLVNACMSYDEKAMKPKYLLEIGKPGSSYAFDMANKLKFPNSILQRARNKMDKGVVNFEDLIRRLEKEKIELSEKNNELLTKIDSLNKLIRAYEHMNQQHEVKKLKLKLEAKSIDYEKALDKKSEANKLIKEIEAKLDIINARKLAEERLVQLKTIEKEFADLNSKYLQKVNAAVTLEELKIGDEVILFKSNLKGTISKIKGSKIDVTTEFITLKVDYKEINLAKKSNALIKKPKAELDLITKAATMSSTIDLRGSLPTEALKQLENYIDLSLLSSLKEFKIIHGKGSGKLRKSVHDLLKKNKFIKSWKHPEDAEGGSGITLVSFNE